MHVIADGSIGRSRRHRQGDRLRRRRGDGRLAAGPRRPRRRAAASTGAPRRWHAELPRGERVEIGTVGTLEEILFGPSRVADGTMNLVGALRRAMATTGYTELKEFQRVEVVVAVTAPAADRTRRWQPTDEHWRHERRPRTSASRRPGPRRRRRCDAALAAPTSSTCWWSAAGWSAPAPRSTRSPAGCRPAWSSSATSPPARQSAASASWSTAACATWRCSTSALVREALEERGLLLTRLAPHLVRPVPFLYPLTHRAGSGPYVGAGLVLYDAMAMAGKYDMGVPRHRHLFRAQVRRGSPRTCAPTRSPARSATTTPGRRRPAGDDARPHRRARTAPTSPPAPR